jgi:hypothetical protein
LTETPLPSASNDEDIPASELLKKWETNFPRFLTILTVVQSLNLSLGARFPWEDLLGIPPPVGWQLLLPTFLPLALALIFWIAGQLSPRRNIRVICSTLAWLPLIFIAITVFGTWIILIAFTTLIYSFALYLVLSLLLIALVFSPIWTDRAALLYFNAMRENGKLLHKWTMPFLVIVSRLLLIPLALLRYQWGSHNTLVLLFVAYTPIDPYLGIAIIFTIGLLISSIYPIWKRKEIMQKQLNEND